MINKKKKWKILLIICVGAFFLILVVKIIIAILITNRSFKEDLPSTYQLPAEDSLLIRDLYRDKINVNVIHNSKVREPISMLFFDQNYHIIIHKIKLARDIPLQSIFHTQIKNARRSTGIPYNLYGDHIFFYFQCKTGLTHPVSEVYLTLSGDSLKTIAENDSIAAYHLLCKNLSVRYEENGLVDIFVIGKENILGAPIIPMDILFLRRQKNLYFLLLTPKSQNKVVPPELLYNIFIKN